VRIKSLLGSLDLNEAWRERLGAQESVLKYLQCEMSGQPC
jgi:hypothetical protein